MTGAEDVVFSFWDASTGGVQLLRNEHTAAQSCPVQVAVGQYVVKLGECAIAGGLPYSSLATLFREKFVVYLELKVATDPPMTPRIRVVSSAYSLNTDNLDGRDSSYFIDTSSTVQTKGGPLYLAGGNSDLSGTEGDFKVGNSSYRLKFGVTTSGFLAGDAYVRALGGVSRLYVGTGNYPKTLSLTNNMLGIGTTSSPSKTLDVLGTGRFTQTAATNATVTLAEGHRAINAYAGVLPATNGYADWAGDFTIENPVDSWARLAVGTVSCFEGCATVGTGLQAHGSWYGGYFENAYTTPPSSATIADRDRGLWARGSFAGGTFSHPNGTTFWADVSTPTRKIQGTGTVSFVQNHPYERDKVIVYAAPEGDEVAVYTRGSARLVNGAARIALGKTFPMVANPDLGLTAHLTPRGAAANLWVESLSSAELVVQGPAGSDVAFDYMVCGLRIGFEEAAIVQSKAREAFLPGSAAFDQEYGGRQDLRGFDPRTRFAAMRTALGADSSVDLQRSYALMAAIDANRESILAEADRKSVQERPIQPPSRVSSSPSDERAFAIASPAPDVSERAASTVQSDAMKNGAEPAVSGSVYPMLPVRGQVTDGSVLAVDTDQAGTLSLADGASGPRVVGIAVGPSESGLAHVATLGIVSCYVDASFGALSVGDVLVASPTPGHAMKSVDALPGTILGKALESLESDTGLVRVLLMPR